MPFAYEPVHTAVCTDKLSDRQKERLSAYPELHRRVTKREYEKLIKHCTDRGIENALIQEGEVAK